MADAAPEVEILLRVADLRARVAPLGASLRGVWRELRDGRHQEIVTAYSGAANKVAGQGDVLIPFPGRVAGGRFTFEGRAYQMKLSDKEGSNAIHGSVRGKTWDVIESESDRARFATTIRSGENDGYPFDLRVEVSYLLAPDGLTCGFEIQNTGTSSAPVAAGFHPYFTVGSQQVDTDLLTLPMQSMLEFDNLLPTGRILPVDGGAFDFRQPMPIGGLKINHCWLDPLRDPDGKVRIVLASSTRQRRVTIWMDESFNYVVLYSLDAVKTHARRWLAIEPMTCATDAFNHPEWGLRGLRPGERFSGAWGVIA